MNPLLDQLVVCAIIAGAVFWLVWRSLARRRNSGKGCGSDCGCGNKKPLR